MYPTIKTPTCQTPFTKPSHTKSAIQRNANTPSLPSDTRKLSLSSQPSSEALMAHPTPRNPLPPSTHHPLTSTKSPTQPPLPSARNRTARETGAGLLRLCRRGADSWLPPDEARSKPAPVSLASVVRQSALRSATHPVQKRASPAAHTQATRNTLPTSVNQI